MLMPSIFNTNLFDDFFDFPFYDDKADRKIQRKLYGHHAGNLMKTDIKEKKDGYLTVSAETNTKKDEKAEDGKYIRRERYSGSCSRSFYVGDGVKQEDIKAKFEDGTLKLFVPKEAAKPAVEQKKYISIEG